MAIRKPMMSALIIIFVLSMASCSPYVYKNEVETFQSGVEAASKMLDTQKPILAKYEVDAYKAKLKKARFPRLSLSEECEKAIRCYTHMSFGDSEGKNCADEIVSTDGGDGKAAASSDEIYKKVQKVAVKKCSMLFSTIDGKLVEVKLEAQPQLPSQMRVLTVLRQYAAALAGIVDAGDKKELETSAASACSSTQQIFLAAANIKPAEDGAPEEEIKKKAGKLEKEGKVVSSVCGLITQIGVATLDSARLKILTRVVNEADPIVRLMTSYLAIEERKIYATMARNELVKFQDAISETVGFQGRDKAEEYFKATEASVSQKNLLNGILSNNPESVFLAMAEAHEKLKAAIKDPKTQLTAAIESTQNFLTAAQAARDAVEVVSDDMKNK